jgi:hypothetical protein
MIAEVQSLWREDNKEAIMASLLCRHSPQKMYGSRTGCTSFMSWSYYYPVQVSWVTIDRGGRRRESGARGTKRRGKKNRKEEQEASNSSKSLMQSARQAAN